MNINSCFLLTGAPALFVLAKTSRIKEEIPNATAVFIQFCIEIEPYLENDLLRPHLQNINDLSISETDPCLEVHLENIRIILEKNPSLLELYMTIIQDFKNIPPELFKVYQIANRYPELLETHLQTVQSMGEFEPNAQLLEVYLRTVKKLKNNPNNALTKYTCGTFTSYQSLKENTPLQDIFFENTGNIWNLAPELVELHLRSIGTLCNFKPQMLKTHLLINNLIYSDPSILEVHLNNMDTIEPQFLEEYIKTTFGLKDNQQLLKLYIHTICITKNTCKVLEVHQKNTQNIRGFPLLLETYFKIILHLENNKSLLEQYIHGIHHINDTQNNQLLKVHFQNVYDFNEELLEPHFQNICNLSSFYLTSYMKTLYSAENYRDKECIIYRTRTITHISESQPDLLDLYFADCQLLENNQGNISLYSYNAYLISQKHPELLKGYFKTVLFLGNTFPNLLWLHLENIQNIYNFKSDSLSEYISTIVESIEANKESPILFYISSVYTSYLLVKNHSELSHLHNTTYRILENQQEDVVSHFCNVLNIVRIHPQLLKNYLEIALFLANTHSNLVWPHLQNIQNIYDSDPDSFKEYILKTFAIKKTQKPLIIHICNTFNIYRIKKQHPLLLQLYQSTSEALKNHPKGLSYHIYNTYRISIVLTQYLHRYLTVVQKIVPVWISQDEPKCLWLNTHLQSIQGFSFEDANSLNKHLQLIFQIDPIFEGKAFLMEEIVKNMQEEEKKEYISISPEIMPYVIAKTVFLYVFDAKYNNLVPHFFNSEIQQKIAAFRKEAYKHNIHKLQKIFTNLINFTNYWNKQTQEDSTRDLVKKIQVLWTDAIQGENNLFMQCWKEAAKTLDLA